MLVVANSPEEAASRFGRLASFAGMDAPATGLLTKQRPGWRPAQRPGLIDDVDHRRYVEDQARGTVPCEPWRAVVIDPEAGRAVTKVAGIPSS
jgi:hypothetical protein